MILSGESVATEERLEVMTKNNAPVHEVRFGRIKACVWENQTEKGVRYAVSIVRLFKDDEGWKESLSFDRDDLPLVAKVADRCHTWIFERITESRQQEAA